MTTASVFVGASVDGFIARPNGELDFLPPGGGEPHGYDEFIASVDALVIGRKTFETVLTFDTWPYGEKPVFVLSTRALASAPAGAMVERMSGDPAEIVSKLDARGIRRNRSNNSHHGGAVARAGVARGDAGRCNWLSGRVRIARGRVSDAVGLAGGVHR